MQITVLSVGIIKLVTLLWDAKANLLGEWTSRGARGRTFCMTMIELVNLTTSETTNSY